MRGSVIDAHFERSLPERHSLLRAEANEKIVIEVNPYPSSHLVRGIALSGTQGLARGATMIDTGQPLQVLVGERLLGRMFNVFGDTIDRQKPLVKGDWRSIHALPVPLAQQATSTDIFQTGIKAIDVLAPLERGGKAALFGGAGVEVRVDSSLNKVKKTPSKSLFWRNKDESTRKRLLLAFGRFHLNERRRWVRGFPA